MFEFEAIISGDCECFCLEVDKQVFVTLKGYEPDEFDRSWGNENKYNIYPTVIFKHNAIIKPIDDDIVLITINLEK